MTVALATMQLAFGTKSPVYAGVDLPDHPILDSNLRFFGGMGLGLGLILLFIVPTIERHTTLFRAVWFCALLGGIGRAVSMAVVGMPPTMLIWFTVIEIPFVPILIWWQKQVSKSVGQV